MIAYIESSAAAKLLVEEDESAALKAHLDRIHAAGAHLFSSVLLETELRRIAVRHEIPQELVTDIVDRFDVVELDRTIFREAGLMAGPNLRSLDALHVATALRLSTDQFLTYDERQAEAARGAGLRTAGPAPG